MNRILTIFLMMWVVAVAAARDYTPDEVTNPNLADRRVYVADPGNMLSADTKARVNETLRNLRQQTTAEVAVAVIPSIGDMPIEDFAEKLFTKWGIGKSDKDNGVLILIAPEQRRARIQTGYGVEGVLPDISAKRIIDSAIVPNMRENNLDAAVEASASAVAKVISDPEAAEELRSGRGEAWNEVEAPVTEDDIITFIMWVAFAFFLFGMGLFVYDLRNTRGKDRYRQAIAWHDHRKAYWILAICSLGLGILPALLAEWRYKRTRNSPLKCSCCGAKMQKLNEEEDNDYLTPAQDFEERINTVDYDVWKCPECGAVERYPFRINQSKYSECPNCHTIAMCLVQDHTLIPATTRRSGEGERVYECQFCHHQNRKRYRIPKRDDGAAAAAVAGGILGAAASRRGGGGGFGGGGFGGGFGGGSTGGGGASGGW